MTGTVVAGALKVAAVGLVSAGIGAGIYFAAEGGGSDGQQSGPQVIATDELATATPLPTAVAPQGTPTPSPPPQGVEGCPPGWQLFDNTLLHYTICYPPDWDISVHGKPVTPSALPREEMGSEIMLTGPGYFPLPEDANLLDLPPEIKERVERAPAATLLVFPPDAEVRGCKPNIEEQVSGLSGYWCEVGYTRYGESIVEYGPRGERYKITMLVPLRNPEPPPALIDRIAVQNTGLDDAAVLAMAREEVKAWRLMIIAGSLSALRQEYNSLLWQIIRSVEVY